MYCRNCGKQIKENQQFCSGCGNKIVCQNPSAISNNASTIVKKKVKKKRNWLFVIVGIIIILLGTGQLALSLVGKTTNAQVTSYERKLFLNNDTSSRNSNRYTINYAFMVDGIKYDGTYTSIFEGSSYMKPTITIRYLTFWPHVNSEDSFKTSLGGPIMLLIGLLLVIKPI